MDQAIEREIQAKGLNAPRITPAMVEVEIACEVFGTADKMFAGCPTSPSMALLTICILTLRNGFTVTGESACASPENFDAEIGRKIARQNAVAKIWPLMGYELLSRLHPRHEDVARLAHEVNRAYCQALGDDSQPPWELAPQWQKDSAMLGVALHLDNPNAGPQASHESWGAQKIADGWKYGPVKDPERKEHPCLVPFDQLPREQQAKDFLFRGVVHAAANY